MCNVLWWIFQGMAFMSTKLMENLALQHPLVMLKTCFCLDTPHQSLWQNIRYTGKKNLWAEHIYNRLLVIQASLGTRRGTLFINCTETTQHLPTNSSNTTIASTITRLWTNESGSCRAEQNQLKALLLKFQFRKINIFKNESKHQGDLKSFNIINSLH